MMFDSLGWTFGLPAGQANSYGVTIATVSVVMMAILVFVFLMRAFARVVLIRAWAIDDTLLLISTAFAIGYAICAIFQTRYGLGLPPTLRPQSQFLKYTHINFGGRFIYQTGICLFKLVYIFIILRVVMHQHVTKVIKRHMRPVLWIGFWYILLSHLAANLVLLFQCMPVNKSWTPSLPGTCLDNTKTFYALGVNTIICDLIAMALAWPIIRRLNLDQTAKSIFALVSLLACFTIACGSIRLWQIKKISDSGDSSGLVLWGIIEICVGNIIIALPAAVAPIWMAIEERTLRVGEEVDERGWWWPIRPAPMLWVLLYCICRLLCLATPAARIWDAHFAPDPETPRGRFGRLRSRRAEATAHPLLPSWTRAGNSIRRSLGLRRRDTRAAASSESGFELSD